MGHLQPFVVLLDPWLGDLSDGGLWALSGLFICVWAGILLFGEPHASERFYTRLGQTVVGAALVLGTIAVTLAVYHAAPVTPAQAATQLAAEPAATTRPAPPPILRAKKTPSSTTPAAAPPALEGEDTGRLAEDAPRPTAEPAPAPPAPPTALQRLLNEGA